jgi:hypothetical protein
MPHPEREHSLQIEVARLTRERDEEHVVRMALEKAHRDLMRQEMDRAEAAESERDALRTALQEVNALLMSVPPGEDWRAVVREKVVKALYGEPGWKET